MKVRPSVFIVVDKQVLLMHYRYGDADVYALPGGNPDRGETLPDTLVRELKEELDVQINVYDFLMAGEVSHPQLKDDVLHCVFRAEITEGVPLLNPAHTTALDIIWKPMYELDSLNIYPNVGKQLQEWEENRLGNAYIGLINQAYFE